MTQVLSNSTLKVIILGLLIASEGFAVTVLSIVSTGQMPTRIQWFGFFLAAFIQLATYLITFLETGQTPPLETGQTPPLETGQTPPLPPSVPKTP